VAIFFASHDPTKDQGPDRGSSYRSIAFYSNALEKKNNEDKIEELTANSVLMLNSNEVKPTADFYQAEATIRIM
jgi:peptide-methionine (S)-S-oxide reductase